MLYVAGDWTLLACSLATVLAVAGCNVSRQASDTGGVDLMAADAGLCPRGLVIASSDYTSTNVSLATAAGVVVSESILSSASAPPGLTTALSGDVVLPTAPSRSGRIVLVDRYPNAVLTWVDPKAAKVEKQLSVGTGFAANPHDYLEIGNKAYVSRYESNPNPGAQPNDSGGDLLVLDPSAPAVTGRVVLASPGDGSLLPRADRMLEVGGEVWVVLQRFDADFKTAGDARIAGVSPERDAVVWTSDLTGVASCGAMALSPSRRFVAVSCTGLLARGEAVARSALIVLDAGARPPVEIKRFGVAAELGAPLAPSLAYASEELLVGVAFGDLREARNDVAYTLNLSTGKIDKLADAGQAFVFGDVRCSAGCGDLCFLTDARSQTLRVWKANGSFLEERAPEAVNPSIGLPRVSSDISDGALRGNTRDAKLRRSRCDVC